MNDRNINIQKSLISSIDMEKKQLYPSMQQMRVAELPGLKASKSVGKDRFRTVDKRIISNSNIRDTSYADERMSFI